MSPTTPAVVLGDLTLVRPLAMADVPLVLVTSDAEDVALRSRHVREHLVVDGFEPAARPATIAALRALGARLADAHGQKPPLFCGTDSQLELLYTHRAELMEEYALLLNADALAWALYDKRAFYTLCERVGVLAPRTLSETGDPDIELDRLREPIVVKPRRKTDLDPMRDSLFGAAAKARVFSTRAELRAHPAWAAARRDLIVQEYIEGQVGCLYSFHGFADEDSRLLACFCGRKVRTFPSFGGESSFIQMITDPALDEVGRDLVARLGLRGPFKIDLIRDPRTGVFVTLEINARFNLWHYLGAVNGVNLMRVAYDWLVEGRAPAAMPIPTITRSWLSLYRDVRSYREQHARGQLGLLSWLRSIASPRNVYEVFAWDDPVPFATWAYDFVRAKVA